MARKTDRIAIAGKQFEFTKLGLEGLDLFHDLRKAVIPSVRRLLTDADVLSILKAAESKTKVAELLDNLDATIIAKLGGVILGAMEDMPKQLERELRQAFAATCKVAVPAEGQHGAQLAFIDLGDAFTKDGVFDDTFSGEPALYMAWFIHALRFNFASFLGSSGSGSPPAKPATP